VADPAAETEWRRKETLRAAWGGYLQEFAWDHYLTLTFRESANSARARRELGRCLRNLARVAQRPVPYFYALEASGGSREHVHAHVLLAGTGHLSVDRLARSWKHGNTRVLCYDHTRGAAFYVSKEVPIAGDDYAVSDRMPPRLEPSIIQGGVRGRRRSPLRPTGRR